MMCAAYPAGAPAEHVVAAEQRLLLLEKEAAVVGGVARREQRVKRRALRLDHLAVAQLVVALALQPSRRRVHIPNCK